MSHKTSVCVPGVFSYAYVHARGTGSELTDVLWRVVPISLVTKGSPFWMAPLFNNVRRRNALFSPPKSSECLRLISTVEYYLQFPSPRCISRIVNSDRQKVQDNFARLFSFLASKRIGKFQSITRKKCISWLLLQTNPVIGVRHLHLMVNHLVLPCFLE